MDSATAIPLQCPGCGAVETPVTLDPGQTKRVAHFLCGGGFNIGADGRALFPRCGLERGGAPALLQADGGSIPEAYGDAVTYEDVATNGFSFKNARRIADRGVAIHFHTWVYETFAELVEWTRANVAPFSDAWSQQTLSDESADFEFYFVLTK